VVGRLEAPAEVRAVDLDVALGDRAALAGPHGFPELVGHHEGRLAGHVQVAPRLRRALALGPVREQGDGQEVAAEPQLARVEDRAAGEAELLAARLAAERRARPAGVDREAAARRADGLAARGVPAERAERLARLVLAQARDRGQRELARGGGGEEALGRRMTPCQALTH
jgi:hypothetical protein